MNVGFLQFNPIRSNVNSNLKTINTALSEVNFDFIVLPELANSGYLYNSPEDLEHFSEHHDMSGPFIYNLYEIAKDKNACLISGFSEKTLNGSLFNSAIAVDKTGVIGHYRKIHLFNTEKDLFSPGNLGFPVFNFRDVTFGMMICFDWFFPEAARTLALNGAQLITHPANLVLPYCQAAMKTRSIENRIFIITANRIGKEVLNNTSLRFTGSSQITAPNGEILISAGSDEVTIRIIHININEANNKYVAEQNNLFEDRRPEYYK